MRSDLYQYALIFLGIIVTMLFGVFLYREVFPEYKIYQNDYIALEEFRSTYTGTPPPAFSTGIQQIVMERSDKGPPRIDRCVSCHVAMKFSHFSPTKIAKDLNGNILVDNQGFPIKVANEEYVWGKLEQRLTALTDPKVLQQLTEQGQTSEVRQRQAEAASLKDLKTAQVGEHVYDVTKVLAMHPLIGRETRPFEYHPMEQYGCTSCHGGNGRGLTTDNAHGPVFDGDYEVEFVGKKPVFTEIDPANDPEFSRIFNAKPGHRLLFQTDPILPGALMQSKCMQCHQSSDVSLQAAVANTDRVLDQYQERMSLIKTAFDNEKEALLTMLLLRKDIEEKGVPKVYEDLKKESADYAVAASEREKIAQQMKYLIQVAGGENALSTPQVKAKLLDHFQNHIVQTLGSQELALQIESQLSKSNDSIIVLDKFLAEEANTAHAVGSIFAKLAAVKLENAVERHVDNQDILLAAGRDNGSAIVTDVDLLTRNFHQGEQLFISQACYACHRISGLARGGVGPELTREGESYPWFVKESIVWPQADLKTSTMPNYRMDHEEVEDLMTFLMAQRDNSPIRNEPSYQRWVQEWEAGKKTPWEKPIDPANIHDLRFGMTVFATQGCAACHRLKGFESNVGFRVEKDTDKALASAKLEQEREWFKELVPETITGTQLISVLEKNHNEIDQRIVDDVRENAILEEINKQYPQAIEALYTHFKFASRAQNQKYAQLLAAAKTPEEKQAAQAALNDWKQRVNRVLMMYIQEYGLGRLIGPRPNWSGIYRSDEWLMDHFHQPSAYVARSIMPVFPFDDSKFYALTYMLDALGIRNRDAARKEWNKNGFNPRVVYEILCLQCHGDHLQGNGPVSEWIYPIPKNLRNADFLRNYSKENVIAAITHGVKGTPMPPWGELATDKTNADGIPVLTKNEILQLTDWLFSSLPGGQVIRGSEDVPKWHYEPEDVLEELKKEGSESKFKEQTHSFLHALLPEGSDLYAALDPKLTLSRSNLTVQDVFVQKPNTKGGPEKNEYYIQKKFYTPLNLAEGQAFFELNCAVCHGKDADGAGLRAGAMMDAKPRMLTNLNWIDSRDDLRLLRSIKYGVAGTSMTPWGDQTTSLQRLQLVMYIRSLTAEQELRNTLKNKLFESFTKQEEIISQARIKPSEKLLILKQSQALIRKERRESTIEAKTLELYKKQLELNKQIAQLQAIDELYHQMQQEIQSQQQQLNNLGATLILKKPPESFYDQFLQLISLLKPLYVLSNKKLDFSLSSQNISEAKVLRDAMLKEIEQNVAELERKKEIAEGKIASQERSDQLEKINNELNGYHAIKNSLIATFEESLRSLDKQQQLFHEVQKKEKLEPITSEKESP